MNNKLFEMGQICEFINGDRGRNYPSSDEFVDNGVPFINAGHIQNNKIDFENMNYISKKKFDILGSGKIMKSDILYCLRGSLGKNAIVDFDEGAIASSLVIIRPRKNLVFTDYLFHYLNSKEINEQILKANNGSSQPNLSAASVKKFIVYLPNYEMQIKISEILNKAQSLIDKRKEQISALDELVKSRFIEMFGDYLEQTHTTIKDIAKDTTVGIANSATHAYSDSGIVMLRNQNIRINYLDDRELIYITTEFAEKYKNKALNENDILVTRTGVNVGMACLVPKKYEGCQTFTTLILRLKDGIGVSPIYVCYYINSPLGKSFVDDNKIGGAQPNLGAKVLETMPIAIPPEKLQNEFSDFVKHVDKLKFEMQKSLEELENNFNSLMQRAFNGELFA